MQGWAIPELGVKAAPMHTGASEGVVGESVDSFFLMASVFSVKSMGRSSPEIDDGRAVHLNLQWDP